MELLETASGFGRRKNAPHPGPTLARDYLAPLGLDVASLAAQIGMDADLLAAMLAGDKSIDVETAVRLSRSLQLNPQTVMEMQLRHDFARARANHEIETIPVLAADGRVTFPEEGFLRGRLAGLRESSGYGEVRFETLGFFADVAPGQDMLTCMYDIRLGARLRIYGSDGKPLWTGPVLETFDGKPLLPYARPSTWIDWFTNRFRADFVPAPGTPRPSGC
jgi:addiction module HigA family antidote